MATLASGVEAREQDPNQGKETVKVKAVVNAPGGGAAPPELLLFLEGAQGNMDLGALVAGAVAEQVGLPADAIKTEVRVPSAEELRELQAGGEGLPYDASADLAALEAGKLGDAPKEEEAEAEPEVCTAPAPEVPARAPRTDLPRPPYHHHQASQPTPQPSPKREAPAETQPQFPLRKSEPEQPAASKLCACARFGSGACHDTG